MTRFELPGAAERRRLLEVLEGPPEVAAPRLLGMHLVRRVGRGVRRCRIVELEAYQGGDDPAAHTYRGPTPRTAPLFEAPGTLYVYFIYGMHYCLNIATEPRGRAGCVLVRAAESLDDALVPRTLSGPGRLCRGLDIDTRLSGRHLFERDAGLTLREGRPPVRVGVSPRIGIRHAADRLLRFFDAESKAVTR